MALIVQKFGGSSLSTVEKIKAVAKRVVTVKRQGHQVIVVVSAMGKTTDELIALAKQVHHQPPGRELDLLLSTGEMVSVALVSMAIEELSEEAEGFPGYFAGIRTDTLHTKARIKRIEPIRIQKELEKGKIVVVAGFQGLSPEDAITTLGRGGSDLTAIALAAILQADRCEIFTDVPGVFTADPNRVPQAKLIPLLSYEEMLEMASTGAKVMQSRAVEFAKKYRVPFTVRATFQEGEGTMVKELDVQEGAVVSSVSLDDKQAKISVFRVPDQPGVAARLFQALGAENINVDMIVQNVGQDNRADISFTVNLIDLEKSLQIAREIATGLGAERVTADEDIAKISIIGIGMMNHPGVAGRMFHALASAGINIEMISTSEIKISCVVRRKQADRAIQAVHREFIESQEREQSRTAPDREVT
ncbi:MAG: aspartate kinase [Candidatus Omnitrophica bacterium]|nr:aspartate kinase [Candidatus Omnitrophota bacterium]